MNIGAQSGLKKNKASMVAPAVEVAGKPYVVMMHMMAGISLKELDERVAHLTNSSASLRDALDFLISGY